MTTKNGRCPNLATEKTLNLTGQVSHSQMCMWEGHSQRTLISLFYSIVNPKAHVLRLLYLPYLPYALTLARFTQRGHGKSSKLHRMKKAKLS